MQNPTDNTQWEQGQEGQGQGQFQGDQSQLGSDFQQSGDQQFGDDKPTAPQVSSESGGQFDKPGNVAGSGDYLDKGVDTLGQKTGHPQKPKTTEKVSDGIRSGFKKMTGKDVPVKDTEYQ